MRKEVHRLAWALLPLTLAACLPTPHRVEFTPPIHGVVTRAGVPVPGARLRVSAQGTEQAAEALSDGDGLFRLPPLSELALSTSLRQDSSYGFVLEISTPEGDFPGMSMTEQGFPPRDLSLDCDLARPSGLGGDLHYCRRR